MSVEKGQNIDKLNTCKCTAVDATDKFRSDGMDDEGRSLKKTVKVGTRGSKLALAQTELVIDALRERFPEIDFQMVTMSTRGDRDTSRALLEFGGKAVFVEKFEEAILKGDIDIAVHSAKDMPMEIMDGLTIAGTLPRACPQDVLIYKSGRTFDKNDSFVVGTSSLRRQYQIKDMYPNVVCKNLRGNVGTRIQKLADGEYDAIVLAAAGLERLGIIEKTDDVLSVQAQTKIEKIGVSEVEKSTETETSEMKDKVIVDKNNGSVECLKIQKDKLTFRYLSTESMLPAACQGIIAIETRTSGEVYEMVRAINDTEAYTQLTCERAVLNRLNAGCHEPIGVYSELYGDHMKLSLMKADASTSDKEKDEEIQIHRKTVEGNTADWEQLVERLTR